MAWINGDWTCDTTNSGYPYITDAGIAAAYDPTNCATVWALRADVLMGYPHILAVFPPDPPGAVPHVDIPRPLIVYAPETRDFSRNGFACLRPTSAEWSLNFGEAGEITVTHPIDTLQKWTALQPNNIILAPCKWHGEDKPQAFRIYRIVKSMDNSGNRTITAYARHVFYDLNYSLLENIAVNKRAKEGLEYLFENQLGYSGTPGGTPPYFYNMASEAWYGREDQTVRNYTLPIGGNIRAFNFKNCSLTDAIIGENSIMQIFGLEFYVDNFYFSLLPVMENSVQNGFAIRYSHDMTAVSEDIDYTSAFTVMYAHDNFNRTYGYSITEETYGPFVRPLSFSFSYDYDVGNDQFVRDCEDYFAGNTAQKISYTASYAPINLDKSKDFLGQLDGREVGDTGTVTNADLGITTTQRIISKRVDLLTDITLEIKLGNAPAYLTKRGAWSSTVTTGAPSATEKQIEALRNA